jgi:alkanesulfonate monooxygenase SsuD/methylene tetrahydromethanopterin reductase-like flavin-dependent oxidoreductase (luciferase family)
MLQADPSLPLMIAAGTEAMIALAAEIGDGWMPTHFAPGMMRTYQPMLDKGFARSADPSRQRTFEIWNHVDLIVSDDIKAAMWPMKQYLARWAGGWSAPGRLNVFRNIMVWRGFGDLQQRLEELWQAGRQDEAAAAIPDDFIDEGWLVGPLPRIIERWRGQWLDSGLSGIILRSDNLQVYEPLFRAAR